MELQTQDSKPASDVPDFRIQLDIPSAKNLGILG